MPFSKETESLRLGSPTQEEMETQALEAPHNNANSGAMSKGAWVSDQLQTYLIFKQDFNQLTLTPLSGLRLQENQTVAHQTLNRSAPELMLSAPEIATLLSKSALLQRLENGMMI
jgi:hypothetical protein